MKSAREVAHWLLYLIGKECRTATGAAEHPSRCNDFTAAITARDVEHAEGSPPPRGRWCGMESKAALAMALGRIERPKGKHVNGVFRIFCSDECRSARAHVGATEHAADRASRGAERESPAWPPCPYSIASEYHDQCIKCWMWRESDAGQLWMARATIAALKAATPSPGEMVRREDVVRWLELQAKKWSADARLCQGEAERRNREWVASAFSRAAGAFRDGSWLRDLASIGAGKEGT